MDDSIWDEGYYVGAQEVIARVPKWLDEDTIDELRQEYQRKKG